MSDVFETRSRIIKIIEFLPDNEVYKVFDFLDKLVKGLDDPSLLNLLLMEEYDEPLTPEEIREAEEGWNECIEGKSRSWNDVKEELESE